MRSICIRAAVDAELSFYLWSAMIAATLSPPSEAFDKPEPEGDYFTTETHYRSLACRITEALHGRGSFVLVVGEPPPSPHLLSQALTKSMVPSDALIGFHGGPEPAGDEAQGSASIIARLPAGIAVIRVLDPSGLARPLFVFDNIDRLSDRQIRDIYEATDHADRIGPAGVLLAGPAFLARLGAPALQFLREAVAAQFRFQEIGQDEGIDFLRHQLVGRQHSPEVRHVSRAIIRGFAALAALVAAGIVALLVLRPMEQAGERSAHSAAAIPLTGQISRPATPNEVMNAVPEEPAVTAGTAAVLPSTLPLASTPQTTPPATLAPLTGSPAGRSLSPAELAALVARGDSFLSAGDVASARLFYERAADAGDGPAALRLAATFDPGFLGRAGIRGVQSDPDQAASWYRRARELGAAAAGDRLQSLEQGSLPQPGAPAR